MNYSKFWKHIYHWTCTIWYELHLFTEAQPTKNSKDATTNNILQGVWNRRLAVGSTARVFLRRCVDANMVARCYWNDVQSYRMHGKMFRELCLINSSILYYAELLMKGKEQTITDNNGYSLHNHHHRYTIHRPNFTSTSQLRCISPRSTNTLPRIIWYEYTPHNQPSSTYISITRITTVRIYVAEC